MKIEKWDIIYWFVAGIICNFTSTAILAWNQHPIGYACVAASITFLIIAIITQIKYRRQYFDETQEAQQ